MGQGRDDGVCSSQREVLVWPPPSSTALLLGLNPSMCPTESPTPQCCPAPQSPSPFSSSDSVISPENLSVPCHQKALWHVQSAPQKQAVIKIWVYSSCKDVSPSPSWTPSPARAGLCGFVCPSRRCGHAGTGGLRCLLQPRCQMGISPCLVLATLASKHLSVPIVHPSS